MARRHVWDADAPSWFLDICPDPTQRTIRGQLGSQRRPDMAALISCLHRAAPNNADLELPLLRRNHKQHVIAGRLRTTAKVGDVGGELAVKASRLFASSVQLEVKKQLAIAHEHPAPTVWHRPPLLRIDTPDSVLPDPVVETQRRRRRRGPRQIDEQLIGFQVVDEVVVAGEGVLGSQDALPRVISSEICEC
ncbi:MAG TPA: hypothetical protein VND96_10675 [Candidatus Micrarchaeaceae archaeon]|nr:hypothetical protein [Candidatus Micrarchaeaceae archaeon]